MKFSMLPQPVGLLKLTLFVVVVVVVVVFVQVPFKGENSADVILILCFK